MSEQVVIGVDVGTTSTKAGAYRLDGSALSTAQVETPAASAAAPGRSSRTRRSCSSPPSRPSRGASSARAPARRRRCDRRERADGRHASASTATGARSRPTTRGSTRRCAPQLRRLAAEHGDLVTARTGCPPMLDHAPKMQWWRDERPAAYAGRRRVRHAGRLRRRRARRAVSRRRLHRPDATCTSPASPTPGRRRWSPELLAALELDGGKLPRIVASDAVVGRADGCGRGALRPARPASRSRPASATRRPARWAPASSVPASCSTRRAPPRCSSAAVDAFSADPEQGLIVMAGVLPGQWLPLNYVAGGGLALPWLADLAASAGAASGERGPTRWWRCSTRPPTVAPGADGLAFIPHLEGRIAPHAPAMRGGFLGLSLAHGRAQLARAILEAVAFEYATYLRAMRRLHPDVEFASARVIGGGARSALWNSIKADVLGVPVERITMDETATRGAALLAASAAGLARRPRRRGRDRCPRPTSWSPTRPPRALRGPGRPLRRHHPHAARAPGHPDSDRKGPRPMNPSTSASSAPAAPASCTPSNIRHHTADAEMVAIVDGDLERAPAVAHERRRRAVRDARRRRSRPGRHRRGR